MHNWKGNYAIHNFTSKYLMVIQGDKSGLTKEQEDNTQQIVNLIIYSPNRAEFDIKR
jgi:hypothetical protein